MILFPFTATAAVLTIASLISKFQYEPTHLRVALHAIFGLLQTVSLAIAYITYIGVGNMRTVASILFPIILGFIFCNNFLGLLIQTPFFMADRRFLRWLSHRKNEKDCKLHLIWYYVLTIFSFLTNYKFKMIIFSRLFNFDCFKGQLESIAKLKIFDIFLFIGLIPEALVFFTTINLMTFESVD